MPKRYRALVPLYYAGDPDVVRAILAGENPPLTQRGERKLAPGDWADPLVRLVPRSTVRLYVNKGLLEEVDESDQEVASDGEV